MGGELLLLFSSDKVRHGSMVRYDGLVEMLAQHSKQNLISKKAWPVLMNLGNKCIILPW